MTFVKINNINVHYHLIKHEDDEAVTFVFINSLGTDYRIWDNVVQDVAAYGNILLADKRGHGLTDVADNTSSIHDYAEDVAALIEYLQLEKLVIIGLSIGGVIAQILAHTITHKILKLILCSTHFKIGNAAFWDNRIADITKNGLASIADAVMHRWFSEAYRQTQSSNVSGYKNMLQRTPLPGYTSACEALRDADLTESTAEIKIPTLCIVGSEDASTTPADVQALAAVVKNAQCQIIQGSGHIPCVDNPKALSNLIIAFVNN